MKAKYKNSILFLVIFLFIAVFVTIGFPRFLSGDRKHEFDSPDPQYITEEQINIIGTWISEADAAYKMVFASNGICYAYYGSDITETYHYSISNTTPKCGVDVLIDESQQTSYLELISTDDGSGLCYEINGVGTLLSLSTVGSMRLVTFTRQ